MKSSVQLQAGLWIDAWQRLRADRLGLFAAIVVLVFIGSVLLSSVVGLANQWQKEVGVAHAPPSFIGSASHPQLTPETISANTETDDRISIADVDPLFPRYAQWEQQTRTYVSVESKKLETLPMGGDRLGRDVALKVFKGTEISVMVGLIATLIATFLGTLFGALSGYLGGKIGDALEWLYNVFEAVPGILLIFAFAAVFGRGIMTVILILGFTGWTSLYRQVRSEFMKHAQRDYVRAAQAIGVSPMGCMFHHILPNVSHVILVRMALLVVGFIKSEVILSYLGLGVGIDDVSWGTILAESQSELIMGYWWQMAAVTVAMCVFVTAVSFMADSVRDALDPKINTRA